MQSLSADRKLIYRTTLFEYSIFSFEINTKNEIQFIGCTYIHVCTYVLFISAYIATNGLKIKVPYLSTKTSSRRVDTHKKGERG